MRETLAVHVHLWAEARPAARQCWPPGVCFSLPGLMDHNADLLQERNSTRHLHGLGKHACALANYMDLGIDINIDQDTPKHGAKGKEGLHTPPAVGDRTAYFGALTPVHHDMVLFGNRVFTEQIKLK